MQGNGTMDPGSKRDAAVQGSAARRVRRYLAQMRPGDRADEIFVIHNVQLGKKRNGEPFLKMLVCDRTARVNGKWWDRGPATLEKLADPTVVRIKGFMEDFQGAPQFIIEQVLAIGDPARIDFAELLPATDKDVDAMFGDVVALLRGMRSPTLRALAESYLADEPLMAGFRRAPAAMMFHHAYLGGLLEHTLAAMRAGAVLSVNYPTLNGDLVVFGIFLHDLAKTWELQYDTCFDYTDGGRLVGHIVKSAMWLEEKARAAEARIGAPLPRDVIDLLQHIILSHHGEHELGFGSAKSPASPEAWAVHLIENLDAKLTMALMACRRDERGRWTDHHKALGGRLFRPDVVAEADAALAKARLQQAGGSPIAPLDEPKGPATSDPLFEP